MSEALAVPESVAAALGPLLEAAPLSQAMESLVVAAPLKAYSSIAETAASTAPPSLAAGIWLYVDDLDRAHRVAQDLHTAEGSMWHAIVHRREGDFWNSKYWLRSAGRLPAFKDLSGYDPVSFVDAVQDASQKGSAPADLIETQRKEWLALMEWCAEGRIGGQP